MLKDAEFECREPGTSTSGAGETGPQLVTTGRGPNVAADTRSTLAAVAGVGAKVEGLPGAGEELPELHLIYGLLPLGVSFFAEQLRLISAQTELDRRKLEGRAALEALPEAQRRELVRAILRREIGVMAASALVVALLGVRASGWF